MCNFPGGGGLKYLFSVHHLSSVSKHPSINDYTIIYNIANERLVPLGVKIVSCHAHLDRTQVQYLSGVIFKTSNFKLLIPIWGNIIHAC